MIVINNSKWISVILGICTTQDVDLVLKHMNNARYLRELDFARFYFYDRLGIYDVISKRGGSAVQGASTIRYRRAIPIFTPYKVTTKVRSIHFASSFSFSFAIIQFALLQLIYWEDKHFYIENQFISLTDNFIRAIALSRQTVTGLKIPVEEIIADIEPEIRRPEPTKELQLWLESMEESSQSLRKQK